MWQPPRGSLPGDAAGQHLLHLRTLRSLRQLQLKGQCELSAELLVQLASHWHCLTGLDLCCVLPDGTQGLQHFTTLRSLRLRPYKWDGELVELGVVSGCCGRRSIRWPRPCRDLM